MNIILASNNNGKIEEIKKIFKNHNILSLNDIENKYNKKIIVNENQTTFKENALQKVRELFNQLEEDCICIADDSGISIDTLDGFPGVNTARWMDANDHIKNIELLKMMENKLNRRCHYTTVIAMKSKSEEIAFENTLDGVITKEPKGLNGFGFDEIFELENGLTLAEIKQEDKIEISPRNKALIALEKYIVDK